MLFLLFQIVSSCEKTFEFSECSEGLMALLITPINCSDSSLSIKESLPCDFSCSSGQFLTFDEETESLKCSLCPEGTYSIGGGVEYNNWNNFKENFHSYCWVLFEEGWEMNEECLGWHSNSDTLLVTGTAPQKLWYEADLIFYPVLVKDGYLELNYRKETTSIEGLEIGDFYIFVDENLAHFDYSVDDYDWKNVKLPLSSGVHKINVVFAKFVTTSTSEAQIRDIQVRGTKFSDYSCKKCEVGHSPIGADSCLLCEVGSYLDIEEKICKKCPEGSISYPGALRVDSCFDAPVCQEIDWHFYYSPCEAGKQKKVFEWNSPMICDPVPVFLPNDEEVNCLPCGAGKVYLEGKCQPCPTGTFTTSGNFGDSCKVCPAGKYAPKVADFHEWTTFPLEFQSICIHADRVECSYDWETRGTFIVSSPIYEVGSKVILQSNFEITEKNASLFFTFKVSGPATKFQFVVNGKKVFEKIGFGEGSEKFLLKVGENSFKWICEHFQKDVESCEISRIVVDGCVNGGAQYCLDCPNGLISEEGSDSCERCEVGMTSNGNHTKCVDCPERSFMDVNGICKDCPEGLNASTHHKSCVLSSEMLRIENETYVLKNFSGTPGESPFYCSEQKLQMFCYGTFYGPAQGDDHYFYISVLNPSQIYMPSYTQLSKSSGYAFGIINYAALGLDYFNLNKPGDGCNITSSKVVANLGSEISVLQNDKDYGSGFKVRYSEGDRCTNSSRFSTLIHFACNKEDEEGWPILLKYEDCEFHFYWPTVHACHVCTDSTVIVHNSTCQDGKKTVHTFESSSCIFENRINYIEKIENCNYSQVYKTWPFILSLLLSGIMLFVVTLTIILACKKRSGYKKLIQYRMEGKNVELQVNK